MSWYEDEKEWEIAQAEIRAYLREHHNRFREFPKKTEPMRKFSLFNRLHKCLAQWLSHRGDE